MTIPATLSLTEDQVYAALGQFLVAATSLSPANIVRGQVNRVPMPLGPDWIVMQAITRQIVSTPAEVFTATPDPIPALGTLETSRSTKMFFQIDAYGPNSADLAQVVTTLFNSSYGVSHFRAAGIGALYCEEPAQMPLVAGEQQYITRWTFNAVLHANIAITTPQDFAATLITNLQEV